MCFYCSAVGWKGGWDRTGGWWEREWEGGGIRSPRVALLLLLLFVLRGPVEIGWGMPVRPVHTIEDTTVTDKQYNHGLGVNAMPVCKCEVLLTPQPVCSLSMPLIQGCLPLLTNSTTGHYNSTCIHSTSLWLVFLASVHQEKPLEHAFIVPNNTSIHCHAYWNLPKAFKIWTSLYSGHTAVVLMVSD